MVKKPDLSDLTSKFDLDKILGGIKSMINPAGGTPEADPDDALGLKIAQLSTLFQETAQSHAELAKSFTKANDILNGLFKDLEAVRESKAKPKAKPAQAATPEKAKTTQAAAPKEAKTTATEKPTTDSTVKPKTPKTENKDEE